MLVVTGTLGFPTLVLVVLIARVCAVLCRAKVVQSLSDRRGENSWKPEFSEDLGMGGSENHGREQGFQKGLREPS